MVLAAFAVVIAANAALVIAATGSFPGLVVASSYVASQDFEKAEDYERFFASLGGSPSRRT